MSDQDFHEIEAKHRLAKLLQDDEDLNNERSGNNVGRINRFGLDASGIEAIAQQKKDHQSLLDFLLSSAAYQEAYSRTMTALNETEGLVYKNLLEASEDLSDSEAKLAEVLDRAQELPDGTKIFRGENGTAFRADGTQVPASEIANIEWREDAATVGEHGQALQTRDANKARFDQLTRFEAELDAIRQKIENKNNPATLEELDEIKQRIEAIREQATLEINADENLEVEKTMEAAPDLILNDMPMTFD